MPQINNNEDSAFVRDDELYNKKIKTVTAPDRIKDIDLNKELYSNIIDASISSHLDINNLTSLNQTAESRNQMYNIYDAMCEDGTIGAVVETYTENATEPNEAGNIMWVESDDDEVTKYVEFLLDSLNINKNIFKWCYCLCKYGDLYLRLYRESEYNDELFNPKKDKEQLNEDIKIKDYKKSDKYVHYMEMVNNPATMFELTKFGKTVGYVKAPVESTIFKQNNTINSTFNFKFQRDDITLYPATEFVHAALEDNISRVDETVQIFTPDMDINEDNDKYTYKVRKGQSLLSSVYKIWRELNLLENSVLLNRITKSSIVRMINVEVGDMPKENVQKTLLGIKQMIEQKAAINSGVGMTDYTNPGPVENNIYIPTHSGIGTISTTQIGGDVDVKSLADLDWYMNKMYGALRVPKQFFNQTADNTGFNGGTSLTIISSQYAKMVRRIQNTLIQAITDAINLMLYDKGLDRYINKFTIHMMPPTTQEELDRRDNMSAKIQLTSDIMNMLADIEDPITKLKILKSLLNNVINDSNVMSLIQDEIDKLEEAVEAGVDPTIDETDDSEVMGAGDIATGGFTDDSWSDSELGSPDAIDDTSGEIEDASEDSINDEMILPTPDDLGVDMSEPEE